MAIKKKKISELPLAQSLVGLHTIGVNDKNKSVKVGLEFVETAASEAIAAAALVNASMPIVENIPGASVVLDVLGGHTYLCGELSSLTLASVADSAREAVIRFRSGATATTLSIPDTLQVVGYVVPAANTSYEINIASNRAVTAWF